MQCCEDAALRGCNVWSPGFESSPGRLAQRLIVPGLLRKLQVMDVLQGHRTSSCQTVLEWHWEPMMGRFTTPLRHYWSPRPRSCRECIHCLKTLFCQILRILCWSSVTATRPKQSWRRTIDSFCWSRPVARARSSSQTNLARNASSCIRINIFFGQVPKIYLIISGLKCHAYQ